MRHPDLLSEYFMLTELNSFRMFDLALLRNSCLSLIIIMQDLAVKECLIVVTCNQIQHMILENFIKVNRNKTKCRHDISPTNRWSEWNIIENLEDMLQACLIDFGRSCDTHLPLVALSYNNSYHINIATPFEGLYGRKCRWSVCRAKAGQYPVSHVTCWDIPLTGPEIIHKTTQKIIEIHDRIKVA